MEDDEVADVLHHLLHLPVVLVSLDRIEATVREEGQQLRDPALDEVDARRLQRLDEPARQPK